MDRQTLIEKLSLRELQDWYDEMHCLKAVEQNGDALQYVDKRVFEEEKTKPERKK